MFATLKRWVGLLGGQGESEGTSAKQLVANEDYDLEERLENEFVSRENRVQELLSKPTFDVVWLKRNTNVFPMYHKPSAYKQPTVRIYANDQGTIDFNVESSKYLDRYSSVRLGVDFRSRCLIVMPVNELHGDFTVTKANAGISATRRITARNLNKVLPKGTFAGVWDEATGILIFDLLNLIKP